MNARSAARFFAMLANGRQLDGVRLLSVERVGSFATPRRNPGEVDRLLARVLNLGIGGFYLRGKSPPAPPVIGNNPHTIAHRGAGGAVGWADPGLRVWRRQSVTTECLTRRPQRTIRCNLYAMRFVTLWD
jgi:CubicO group peptidase (beta-lactamase class C family)